MKKVKALSIIILLMSVSGDFIIAKEIEENPEEMQEKKEVKPLRMGNFSLPPQQQPGPLVSFGQDVLPQGVCQVFNYFSQLKGTRSNYITVTPSIVYGITDLFSVLVSFPVAAKFQFEGATSHGVSDFYAKFEYAPYFSQTLHSVNLITVLA